jgi:hypothetical protein
VACRWPGRRVARRRRRRVGPPAHGGRRLSLLGTTTPHFGNSRPGANDARPGTDDCDPDPDNPHPDPALGSDSPPPEATADLDGRPDTAINPKGHPDGQPDATAGPG